MAKNCALVESRQNSPEELNVLNGVPAQTLSTSSWKSAQFFIRHFSEAGPARFTKIWNCIIEPKSQSIIY